MYEEPRGPLTMKITLKTLENALDAEFEPLWNTLEAEFNSRKEALHVEAFATRKGLQQEKSRNDK